MPRIPHDTTIPNFRFRTTLLASVAALTLLISILVVPTDRNLAFAQASTPQLTVRADYATFSYGMVSVSVEIANPVANDSALDLKFYDPTGKLVGEKTDNFYINTYNGNGTYECYCFSITRQYANSEYTLTAAYHNQTSSFQLPSFTSKYGPPTIVSFQALEPQCISSPGCIIINGRVQGGLAGENVSLAIFPTSSNIPVWQMNEGTNLHAIFEASFNGSAASALFPTGTYRVVATHVVSGASAETTLNYTNPNEPVSPASPPPTTTTTATNATRGSLNSAASVPEPVTQSSSQTIAEPHTSVAQVPISNSAWPAENNNIPTTTQSIESNVAGGTIGSIALIQNKIFTLYGSWGIQSASKNSVTQSESNSNTFVSNITLADSGNGNSQTFTLANVGPLNMVSAASIGTMNNSTSDSSTSIASTDSNPLLLSIKGNATIKQLGTTIASAGNNNTTINNNATLSAVVETGTLYDVFKIELSGNNELPATIYGIAKKIGTSALSQSLPDLD